MTNAALVVGVFSKLADELITYGVVPLAAIFLACRVWAHLGRRRSRVRNVSQPASQKEGWMVSRESDLGASELESLLREIGLGLLLIDLGRSTEAREVIRVVQRDLSKRLSSALASNPSAPYDWAEDDLGSKQHAGDRA